MISTATVALQEQLIYRDLPDIRTHSGLKFTVRLAKGRGRYVCLQKLDSHLAGTFAPTLIPLYPDEGGGLSSDQVNSIAEAMLDALANGSWDGDLDSWPVALEGQMRRAVTVDALQCGGRRCGFVNKCSFFQARNKLLEADIIVANHNIVLTDLKFGGGVILPPPEECIFIFDEGHQLAEKCLEQFTLVVRSGGTRQALCDTRKWLSSQQSMSIDTVKSRAALIEQLLMSLSDLEQSNDEVVLVAENILSDKTGDYLEFRFERGVLPEELLACARELTTAWRQHFDLVMRLETLLESHRDEIEHGDRDKFDAWMLNVKAMAGRAGGSVGTLGKLCVCGETRFGRSLGAMVAWFLILAMRLIFYASPILARDLLKQHIWNRAAVCSADFGNLVFIRDF